jgi:hypothetical protein
MRIQQRAVTVPPQIYKPGEDVPISLDGVVVACIPVSDILP